MVLVLNVRTNVCSPWVGWEVCGVAVGMLPMGSNEPIVMERASVASMAARISVPLWVQYDKPCMLVGQV